MNYDSTYQGVAIIAHEDKYINGRSMISDANASHRSIFRVVVSNNR